MQDSTTDEAIEKDFLYDKENASDALFEMGLHHLKGLGMERNHERARVFFELAAACKNSTAEIYLALCYHYGLGVSADSDKAIKLLQRIAETGNLELYEKAADQGYVPAQYKLRECYKDGIGVEIDLKKAETLYIDSDDDTYTESASFGY